MTNLSADYKIRIERVRKLLIHQNLEAALISSPYDITYLTGYSNFSHEEREAFLIITKEKQYIFTDGRYKDAILQEVPHFELILITADNSFEKAFSMVVQSNNIHHVGIDEENISIKEEKYIRKVFSDLQNLTLSSLRIQKDHSEIEAIKEACKIGDLAFQHVLKNISKDITEQELAFQLELFIKQKGADLSFPSIVAFGPGSSIPHHATSNTQHLKPNSIVLLDFGVKYNNYCSDMTRTIFFGKAPKEFKKMYNTVKTAQEKALEYLQSCHSGKRSAAQNRSSEKNGSWTALAEGLVCQDDRVITGSDLDAIARDYIISQGYPTIPHSLGHGIGLQVHESPRLSPNSKDELKEGMVFSIEPGIYLPRLASEARFKTGLSNVGGVRIEDLVTIHNGKIEILTASPRNLIEI